VQDGHNRTWALVDQNRPVILFHFFGDSFPFYVSDFMIKKCDGDSVKFGYTDINLCHILAIMLCILQYQLIPYKACVFLPCLV